MSRLVLIPEDRCTRKCVFKAWKGGKAFRAVDTMEYFSIRRIHELRGNYSSIVIQYDKGVIEV